MANFGSGYLPGENQDYSALICLAGALDWDSVATGDIASVALISMQMMQSAVCTLHARFLCLAVVAVSKFIIAYMQAATCIWLLCGYKQHMRLG